MKLDDFKELWPASDGSTRRRLISGFVFLGSLILLFWDGSFQSFLKATDLQNGPIAVGALLLVYASGVLIEIVGEALLSRAFGGSMWGTEFPTRSIDAETPAARWVLRALAYYIVVPVYAYWGLMRGLIGKCPYTVNLTGRLNSEVAQNSYSLLPEFVRRGLSEPYGGSFEAACIYVLQRLNESDRMQMNRMFARNKDILSVVSAIIVVGAVYAIFSHTGVKPSSEGIIVTLAGKPHTVPPWAVPLAVLIPIALFALHHLFLLATIVCSLELYALEKDRPSKS